MDENLNLDEVNEFVRKLVHEKFDGDRINGQKEADKEEASLDDFAALCETLRGEFQHLSARGLVVHVLTELGYSVEDIRYFIAGMETALRTNLTLTSTEEFVELLTGSKGTLAGVIRTGRNLSVDARMGGFDDELGGDVVFNIYDKAFNEGGRI